tara:strand:+ start:2853 stop:3893 length:1041 start_codon:yes stop_codon:yes gene_type:complete
MPTDTTTDMQKTLETQIEDTRANTAIVQARTLQRIQFLNKRRDQKKKNMYIVISCIVLVCLSISLSVSNLRRKFPIAYEWWNSDKGYMNTMDYPVPRGKYPAISIPSCALSATYPPVATFSALTFKHTKIPRNGAIFLLNIITGWGFSNRLSGLHWNGSADQLNLRSINYFLPTSPAALESDGTVNWSFVWVSWNAVSASDPGLSANPWSTLWKSADDFTASPVIQAYYKRDPKAISFMRSLFDNGLCGIVMEWMNAYDDNTDLVFYVFGKKMPTPPSTCNTADIIANGAQYGTMGAGMIGMFAAMALGPIGVITATAIGGIAGGALGATVFSNTCEHDDATNVLQ